MGNAVLDGLCAVSWAQVSSAGRHDYRLLDDIERRRAEGFRRATDRDRFVAGAVLLRKVVGAALAMSADAVRVDRTCASCGRAHGRPRIVDGGMRVSVSHSGEFAVVATSTVADVGVDVEQVVPIDYRQLGVHVFAPDGERPATTLEDFFRVWTRKESVLKATGAGMTVPMSRVRMTPPSQDPGVLDYDGRGPLAARVVDVAAPAGYAAAVAALRTVP